MFEKGRLRPLEEEINFNANQFFSITKMIEELTSKRDTKKTILITKLLDYYKEIYGKEFTSEFSSTIFLTLEDTSRRDGRKIGVLANYSPEKGSFLNYCNRSVKLQIQREIAAAENNQYSSAWKQLERLAKSRGLSVETFDDAINFGKMLGWSEKKVMNAWDFGRIQIISEVQINSSSEESCNFDAAAAERYSEGKSHEEEILNDEAAIEKFHKIDGLFRKRQERTKPFLSALLTHKFADELLKFSSETYSRFSFTDKAVLEEIRKNPKLKQQDVAKKFKRDTTDASRTLKNFLEKLQKI